MTTIAEMTESLDQSQKQSLVEECEAFERLLGAVIRAYANIEDHRRQWEEAVRARTVRFNFQTDQTLTNHYRHWVFNARICLRQLALQEEKGCHPASAEAFRECLDNAEETLLTRTQDEAAAIAVLKDAV